MINAVTGINSLTGLQTLRQYCNLLNEEQADRDIRLIGGIGETWKANLMVCCRHGEPNYLVLEFNRKPVEGEDAIVLFGCKGKYPSKHCCWKGKERWIEQ